MSYTKGQWHPVLSSDGTIIFDDDDKRIAFVDSREDSDNYELENARLMCAAPDMYEALKTICEAFMCGKFYNAMRIAGINGQQALSKAEGK